MRISASRDEFRILDERLTKWLTKAAKSSRGLKKLKNQIIPSAYRPLEGLGKAFKKCIYAAKGIPSIAHEMPEFVALWNRTIDDGYQRF
jgi:hypothetical protein